MRIFSLKRIYTKVLLSLSIVIIPILVLSAIVNDKGIQLGKAQVSSMIQQKTKYMMNALEDEIDRIIQLQKSFIDDKDLQALNFRSEYFSNYEWTNTVNQLNTKLQLLNSSSKYITSTSIMMTSINETLSSAEGLNPLDRTAYNELVQRLNEGDLLLPKGNNVLIPLAYPSIKRPFILLVIAFNIAEFHNQIALLNNDAVTVSTTLLMDDDGKVLFNTNQAIDMDERWAIQMSELDSQELHMENYIIHKQKSSLLDWSLVTIYDEKTVWTSVAALYKWHWTIGIAAIASIIIFSYFIYRLVHRPMNRLLRSFRRVQDGDLQFAINHDKSDEFSYMYYQFNRMMSEIDQLIKQNYEKTIHNQKMELKHLQSQINPHFLYNSLYVLYRMSQEEDFIGVTEMSKHLGDYFKFLTRNAGDVIALRQEIEHAQTYAAIQQIRFGERVKCQFDIDGNVDSWYVPRLIIQPLVENAYQHGHQNTDEDGLIAVIVQATDQQLKIIVSDNGSGMSEQACSNWNERMTKDIDTGDGDGMWNVHRRIRLTLGDNSGLSFARNTYGGLSVRITVNREGD